MQLISAEQVLVAGATLGESPVWDHQHRVLWWVDIEQGILNRFDSLSMTNEQFKIGQRIGCVIIRQSRGLLLALQSGIAAFDDQTRLIRLLCNPELDMPENRFNDGKCDPEGRLWVGTMNLDPRNHTTGSLYSIDVRLHVRKHLSNIGVSNGIAWSSDGRTMYYIDSKAGSIDAFDYDGPVGNIGNRRIVYKVPEGLGRADGMAIDVDDNLWVACYGGWCVAKIDPRHGRLVAKISLPVANVTACAFGGDDLQDLYITTAKLGLDAVGSAQQPQAGSLFRARTDVAGAPANCFCG
jgi:sugar lactone lactonase YvrE